jgi:hypothetical protein
MAKHDTPAPRHRSVRGQETLFEGSITEERHPEVTPQNPSDFADKMSAETDGNESLLRKTKKLLNELDRDIGGEYQRREDPTSPPPIREHRE